MKEFKEFCKKYPCFAYGLIFVALGFIFHNKSSLDFAIGVFVGAIIYESKEK